MNNESIQNLSTLLHESIFLQNAFGKNALIFLFKVLGLKYKIVEYDSKEYGLVGDPALVAIRLEVDNISDSALIYGMDGYYCDFLFNQDRFVRVEIYTIPIE